MVKYKYKISLGGMGMKRGLSTLLSASLAVGSITASLPEVFADDYVCDFTE